MHRANVVTRAPMVRRPPSSQTLYISDLVASSVTLFPANVPSPSPIAKITDGIDTPEGIAVDAKGTLYVANSAFLGGGSPTVTQYPAGSVTPSVTIKMQYPPMSVVADAKGNVYVGGNSGSTVEIAEYAPGGTTPIKTVFPTSLHGFPFMGGLAVDSRDNLYASFFVYNNPPAHVVKFAPGLKHERDLNLAQLGGASLNQGLGRDAQGNLYVGGALNGINVYAPGSHNPSRLISGGESQFFAVGKDGSLYDPTQVDVLEFAPGAGSPDVTFKGSLEFPQGAAIH
jgi:hypothetical protein